MEEPGKIDRNADHFVKSVLMRKHMFCILFLHYTIYPCIPDENTIKGKLSYTRKMSHQEEQQQYAQQL